MIELKNVGKLYKNQGISVEALTGINLRIEKSEFIALMGPSGCGKSTLLHLLGGVDTTTKGDIYISDYNLVDLNDNKLTEYRSKHIGFVFQNFNLLPIMNIKENIAFPLQICGYPQIELQKKVTELIALMGLEDVVNHQPSQLSGGQQQRVAIARAFVTDPQIILMDEPTGSLDTKSSQAVLELIAKAQERYGATIIMATHNPFVAACARRIIFLKDGKIKKQMNLEGKKSFSVKDIYEITMQI